MGRRRRVEGLERVELGHATLKVLWEDLRREGGGGMGGFRVKEMGVEKRGASGGVEGVDGRREGEKVDDLFVGQDGDGGGGRSRVKASIMIV